MCIWSKKMHVLENYSCVLSRWSCFRTTTVFWELKFIREICKCSFCKHKRCGARLKGKLRTTKDFRSIPGAYLRSGRISSVAWNQKFHWGWTIFPFQAIGWCSALIYSFPTCYWKYWTLENTHYVIKQVMLLYYLL